MADPVSLPLWLFALILLFAAISFATHFLFPSVRWFFRRRAERLVRQLNRRLQRPIEPFKLLRRYDLIQRVLYHPDVTRAILDHARAAGLREDVAFEQARRYAREIVPAFSAYAYYGWGVWLARRLSNALYRVRLEHQDAAALAAVDPEATLVFVMNHRSNMDYVLVTHLSAERSALAYAVGEWARVWPLSPLVRSMGAYFIRRRSGDGLYRPVLRRYVQMSTEAGVTQAIFPEGGLSLDGGLQAPRLGLLRYITDAQAQATRDVVFVPVALNYDRVLEDRVLIGSDGSGRFAVSIPRGIWATAKQLWLRVTGRFHRFGTAAVRFGTPLSLRAEPALARDPEALAARLMAEIARNVPVLPVPLIAHLLLEAPRRRAALAEDLARLRARLDPGAPPPAPAEGARLTRSALRLLEERGIVVEAAGFLRIDPAERELAAYYARSIAHLMPAGDAAETAGPAEAGAEEAEGGAASCCTREGLSAGARS
jgi:glycerol-3-phosphate O-acyltransferase